MLNELNTRLSREGLIGFVLHEQGTPEPMANLNLITGTIVSAPATRLPARPAGYSDP